MKRAIKEYTLTGECPIDIEKAVKYWHKNCKIYKTKKMDGLYLYRLVETSPKGKVIRVKVTISEKDAQDIITKLNLYCMQDAFFRNACVYMQEEV